MDSKFQIGRSIVRDYKELLLSLDEIIEKYDLYRNNGELKKMSKQEINEYFNINIGNFDEKRRTCKNL